MGDLSTDTALFRPRQIAEFIAGDTERTAMHASAINELVDVLNALLKLQVVQGQDSDSKVVWSDSNVIIELAKNLGGGGGSVNFKDQYNGANTYNTGDLVWTTRNGYDRILWIAVQSVPAATVPTWPEPGTVYWRCIARTMIYMGAYDLSHSTVYEMGDLVYTGGTASRTPYLCLVKNGPGTTAGPQDPAWPEPGGTVYWRCLATGGSTPRKLAFSYMKGDYMVCLDGATPVNVAKPYKLRNSIAGATVYGDSITYDGYSTDASAPPSDAAQTRTAHDASGDETQVIVPEYLAGDPIWAITVDHTGVTVGGTELTLIDMNVDGRAWAKISS